MSVASSWGQPVATINLYFNLSQAYHGSKGPRARKALGAPASRSNSFERRRYTVAEPVSEYWCKAHYLDASALVKLVDDSAGESEGRDALRKYCNDHASMYSTSYCLAEAFGVFKRKFLSG
jgi:hypothetical protein